MTENPPVIEVTDLPVLDRDRMQADAYTWMDARLSRLKDPVARLKRAVEVYRDEAEKAAAAEVARDDAVYLLSDESLYRVKRGTGVAEAAGLNRSGTKKSRDYVIRRLEQGYVFPPELMANAHRLFPELAREAMLHGTREQAALEARDRLVGDLIFEHGWANRPIADIIGTHPSQVSHIKKRDPRNPEKAGAS